jgi:glycosyltransferase involved in cell wall biosynthesis
MRIAIITNRYPMDSDDTASPFVSDFCHALSQRDCELRVLTPFYPPARAERDPWVRRFRWSDSDRVLGQLPLSEIGGLWKAACALYTGRTASAELVREFRPEFVLALWALPSGWWARHAAQTEGVPYGVWCLGSDIQVWGRKAIARGVIRGVLQGARLVYADGFALADETARLAGRPCGFLPTLRTLAIQTANDMPHPLSGRRYFLFLGRLAADKGVLDLLDAARLLGPTFDHKIMLAGQSDPALDVTAEISRREIASVCTYVGRLDENQLQAYLSNAEAVILPSHHDSIPLVFGEAMQMGTPVICSDLPDFSEVLSRYKVGMTVRAKDPSALATALRSFEPPAAIKGEAERFVRDFSPQAAAERLLADLGAPPKRHEQSTEPAHTREQAYA